MDGHADALLTDGRTDDVIAIGHLHFKCRALTNNSIKIKMEFKHVQCSTMLIVSTSFFITRLSSIPFSATS